MVDTSKALETAYLNVEYVKNSKERRATIIAEGEYMPTDYGEKLTIPIIINGVRKLYRPNRDSIKNIREAYGLNTQGWVGHDILLSIISMKAKDVVIAIPAIAQQSLKIEQVVV